jgi:hypothetical protein
MIEGASRMLHAEQIEELITVVSALDRAALVQHLRSYQASFPVDFTREFLERQPVDRLRHLFVAMCLQQQRLPQLESSDPA